MVSFPFGLYQYVLKSIFSSLLKVKTYDVDWIKFACDRIILIRWTTVMRLQCLRLA
jgi:hypothetical protein